MELAFLSSSRFSMPTITQTRSIQSLYPNIQSTPMHAPLKPLQLNVFKGILTSTTKQNHRLLPHRLCALSGDGDHPKEPDLFQTLYDRIKTDSREEMSKLIKNDYHSWWFKFLPIMILLSSHKESLMAFLVNHVEFVIRPDGTDLGIKWYFEWKNSQIALGNTTLNFGHVYQGKLLLRNSIFEPFLVTGLIKGKLEETFVPMLDKVALYMVLVGKRKAVFLYCLLSVVSMATSLILLKNTFV